VATILIIFCHCLFSRVLTIIQTFSRKLSEFSTFPVDSANPDYQPQIT